MRRLRRLSTQRGEAGMTLVELLVASMMSVILVGAVGSMLVSAMRTQPKLSERAQNVSTARWVLERMTREIRNGIVVYDGESTSSKVAFLASVRRDVCGGSVEDEVSKPAIQCRVTYACTTTSCSRAETAPEVAATGPGTTLVTGLGSSNVFNYSPNLADATYIGVTLRIPNPSGDGDLTVSDGATLRTLTFTD